MPNEETQWLHYDQWSEIGWLEALAYAKFRGELGFLQAAADGALIRQTADRISLCV
jgi:hypothetical protein